jgi:hypothetical protein
MLNISSMEMLIPPVSAQNFIALDNKLWTTCTIRSSSNAFIPELLFVKSISIFLLTINWFTEFSFLMVVVMSFLEK